MAGAVTGRRAEASLTQCWACGGLLRLEPARLACRLCGSQAERHPEGSIRARLLQLKIDYALRPRSLGSSDVVTLEEYVTLIGAAEALGLEEITA